MIHIFQWRDGPRALMKRSRFGRSLLGLGFRSFQSITSISWQSPGLVITLGELFVWTSPQPKEQGRDMLGFVLRLTSLNPFLGSI
ncbi:hypothetical protein LINPERHAP1_LOCUS8451 [Linum perenne]